MLQGREQTYGLSASDSYRNLFLSYKDHSCILQREDERAGTSNAMTPQLWVHVYLETRVARVLPKPDGGQKRKTEES